jgi:hypothetical protein
MLSVKGIYDGEKVVLLEPIPVKKKLSAIIMLFENEELQDMTVESHSTASPQADVEKGDRSDTIDGRTAMLKLCEGLGRGPADLATNHDHYLYGCEKKK